MLNNIADFARPNAASEEASFDEVAPNLIAVVRERLLVSLADVNWGVEAHQDKKVPAPVHEPISRWFLRTLVIDAPTHMAYVNEEQLQRWNLTFDEAYALALANLQAATIPKFKDEGGIYLGQWGDAYDASRVLVPDIFDDLPITGEPVFVLPNRDTLLVTDSSNVIIQPNVPACVAPNALCFGCGFGDLHSPEAIESVGPPSRKHTGGLLRRLNL